MDLQGMQSMVLTLGNGQIWLGAPPVALQFIFVFFHFVVLQMPLREKRSFRSHSDIWTITQWRSQPKNFGGGKLFNFRRITLFCLKKCLSKHKMTTCSKHF